MMTDRRRLNGHRSLIERARTALSWALRAGVDRRKLRRPAEDALSEALADFRASRDRARARLSALETLAGEQEAPGGR